MIAATILMFFSTLAQNASFTLVSRARNSKSLLLNGVASVISNTVFILVLRQAVLKLDQPVVLIAYVAGATTGSVLMHYVSMRHIEHRFEKKAATMCECGHGRGTHVDDMGCHYFGCRCGSFSGR